MSRSRFVKPKLIRLPLSGGDWVDVKERLNIGEWFEMFALLGEASMRRDMVRAQILAYVVEWSFRDEGQPVAFSADALSHIDLDTYHELDQALGAHITAQAAAQSAEKNVQDGENTSAAPSPSAVSSI